MIRFLKKQRRRGLTALEVVFLIVVMFVLFLVILLALPRGRENARMANCRRNLMQIGAAVALYAKADGALPFVPMLESPPALKGSPIAHMLGAFGITDFTELADTKKVLENPANLLLERRLAGLLCQSDPHVFESGGFPAPVSYRATTGDQSTGKNGGFAPGRRITLAEIEDDDGLAYTASFSERLIGSARDGEASDRNYQHVPGTLGVAPCPAAGQSAWKGDAGKSWLEVSWRSSLYNHTITPNASPSCITDDLKSAFMGASSGHPNGVNLLMFDGSVRTVLPTIAGPIWSALATTSSPPTEPPALLRSQTASPDVEPR